jgi:adenine deaminase
LKDAHLHIERRKLSLMLFADLVVPSGTVVLATAGRCRQGS